MSERTDKSIPNDSGDDHEQQEGSGREQEKQRPVPQYYTTRRQSPNGGRKLPKRKTPLGQLPDSLDEVNLTTTDHGEDVARSLGGIAAMPAAPPVVAINTAPASSPASVNGWFFLACSTPLEKCRWLRWAISCASTVASSSSLWA